MEDNAKTFGEMIIRDAKGRGIFAKTHGQLELVKSIDRHDIIFIDGPAGSGKTFLSCVMAAKYLAEGLYDRVVLVRPVVEAGASLGFLPGSAEEKVSFYMKPLYEFMSQLLKTNKQKEQYEEEDDSGKRKGKRSRVKKNPPIVREHKETSHPGVIDISPLIRVEPIAYMRGMTLDRTILIGDEMQNTTKSEMKMLLTRIGKGSKFILTGDVDQCDLKLRDKSENGLNDAMDRLCNVDNIGLVELTENDIVRNKIIRDILKAYNN